MAASSSWVPRGLEAGAGAGIEAAAQVEAASDSRPLELVHGDIIEYLKGIPRELKAAFVDIERELGVDLHRDNYVLDMLKSNPKVECERGDNDEISFRYRTKFSIANKLELIREISRVGSGIAACDIMTPPCYHGIDNDIQNLIVGGDIIACRNKTIKSIVLYPRGKAFLSNLSGTVTATPGQQSICTSESLTSDIRRGDAIGISGSWYRVASNVGSVGSHQAERATAPLSVTSDMEMSDRNIYRDVFDNTLLPLDGDYDGEIAFVGQAVRHGVTNDVRALWKQTLDAAKHFNDADSLRKELIKCNLLSSNAGSVARAVVRPKEKKQRERKKRKARDTGRVYNAHLGHGALGEALALMKEQGGTD